MSAITIGGDLVHYEDLGRGKPVILLHSWLGSWRYWIPTMQQLSVSKYRTYAIDLWGFGDSSKVTEDNAEAYYTIEGQAKLLDGFLEKMGISKAVFIGHGLGAAVLAHYASNPERGKKVHRMVVVSPPLFDTGPMPSPKAPQALTANTAAKTPSPNETLPVLPADTPKAAPTSSPSPTSALPTPPTITPEGLAIPMPDAATIPSMSPDERRKLLEQVALAAAQKASPAKPETPPNPPPLTTEQMKAPAAAPTEEKPAEPPSDSALLKKEPLLEILGDTDLQKLLSKHMDVSSNNFEKLKTEVTKTDPNAVVFSCRNVHTYREILNLDIPLLVLFGLNDTLMKLSEEKLREQLRGRKQLALVEFDGVRHYPMLEDTAKFTRLLKDFLESPEVENLTVKEEWRRRTR